MEHKHKVQVKVTEETDETMMVDMELPPNPPDPTINNWRRWGRNILLGWLFVLPWFFLPFTVAPGEIHKTVVTLTAVVLSIFCFFMSVFQEQRIRRIPKEYLIGIAAVITSAAVSTFFSKSALLSLYGSLVQPDALILFILYGLLFVLGFYFFSREDIEQVGVVFLCSIALTSLLSIPQIMGWYPFPWGFARTTNFTVAGPVFAWGLLAAASVVAILAAPAGALQSSKRKTISAAVIALGLLSLFLLNYQYLWFALAATIILIAAVRFMRQENVGLATVLLVVCLFFGFISPRLHPLSNPPLEVRPTAASTLSIIRHTLLSPRLVTGTGLGTFGLAYSAAKPDGVNQTGFWSVRFGQGFSLLLTLLVNGGMLLIAALVFLMYLVVRSFLKSLDDPVVATVAIVAIFLMISWLFYIAVFPLLALFFFFFGLLTSFRSSQSSLDFSFLERKFLFGIFLSIIVLVVGTLAGAYSVGQKYLAAVFYERALAQSQTNLDAAFSSLNQAIGWNAQEDEYWRLTSQLFIAKITSGAISDQSSFQNSVSSAIAAAKRATELNPEDSFNWDNLGQIYEALIPVTTGADAFAQASYQKAASLDTKNPQEDINIARTLITLSDKLKNQGAPPSEWGAKLVSAREYVQKAIDLKPNFALAHFLMAQAFLKEGNLADAIRKAQDTEATDPFDAGLAFQVGLMYYYNGQFDKAQGEFQRAVGLDSNYANARYFLGLLYDRNGLTGQALEQFRKIAELNPENQEVKTIIENLKSGRSALSGIAPPAPEARSQAPVPESQNKPAPSVPAPTTPAPSQPKKTGTKTGR